MNEDSEPPAVEIKPNDDDNSGRVPFTALLIGVFWLLLPAVQYIGAAERTEMVVNPSYSPGALGALDLTPWYVILVGATALYAGIGLLQQFIHGRAANSRIGAANSWSAAQSTVKYEILERAGDGAFFQILKTRDKNHGPRGCHQSP